jgi:hypothetical protein
VVGNPVAATQEKEKVTVEKQTLEPTPQVQDLLFRYSQRQLLEESGLTLPQPPTLLDVFDQMSVSQRAPKLRFLLTTKTNQSCLQPQTTQ